ncbi:MAG: 3'-5' exoribonuclease [Chloroflexi bacterium]|nr:3'-5' exoribonuclease [Chloroflexota bacterium]
MRLFEDAPGSPFDEVCVALDLETTGLDPEREEIIEIGGATFRGEEVLGTFQTLVNPRRAISDFVKQLTGITQAEVDKAPPLSAVAAELMAFLGRYPIVGHSIAFDLAFLAKAGLNLPNPRYDTMELASVLFPSAKAYSLTGLADMLSIPYERAHRALDDASLSRQLYLALLRHAQRKAPSLLGPMTSIAERSPWALRGLLRQLQAHSQPGAPLPSTAGLLGVDVLRLRGQLGRPRPLHAREATPEVEAEEVRRLLREQGPMARAFPGYEMRPQQVQMAEGVAAAFSGGGHLLVEAGTGVGKSVAYLLPAILFALRGGGRVVVSTNTINLQEQLINKDIPHLVSALRQDDRLRPLLEEFRYTHLKGRGNYLCFRRWAGMAQSPTLSAEDARMACKVMVWLQETSTGDRAEMNIPSRDSYLWDRLSAADAGECDGWQGVCFLRGARARADASHLVVVNHSLLFTDLASSAGVIPPYDYLVIDEAHHLEEEASRQFGLEINWQTVEELSARLGQQVQAARTALRASLFLPSRREQIEDMVVETLAATRRLGEAWGRFANAMTAFVQRHREGEDRTQLRVTRAVRNQPGWSELEVEWEGLNEHLLGLERLVSRLVAALEPLDVEPLKDVLLELRGWQEKAQKARAGLEGFVVRPDESNVYWVSLVGQEELPVLNAAPLNVGPLLQETLFSQKASVVLTSATLSIEGSTAYVARRVGLEDAQELVLGSPFDYEKAALVLMCPEMPDPREPSYAQALQEALMRVARASRGGMLALFTSHSALRAARRAIKPVLDAEGMLVLAQGVDGSPRQMVEQAQAAGNVVLLGTSSLWEGIDVPGDNLRVVVVTRLPFNVPTEPLFAARAEGFANPFTEYTVPQAVLRFRQGFGRLIRSKEDRGVVVVLDSRVKSKGYGKVFMSSLPPCTVRQAPLRGLGQEVVGWLDRRSGGRKKSD